ncbi:methylation protein EvaC [Sinosporangium album]|uniref:Methylation protein EvaC n=1 Tax=Sinosporangium album TaxID=504805 RepID=A0A1G8GHK5_9ACTN|nr:class I SAM-dependent methyltransferase [Sinosporangium album]SDH93853.1 methylation protein EvaC [Sinosporangium album]
MPNTSQCRVCPGQVGEFFDFGRQPVADAFVSPGGAQEEFFYRLRVGACSSCTMVQLMEEVDRQRMFHEGYPYVSSGSSVMRSHFEGMAKHFLTSELTGKDPFIVELGSNDGIMLKTIADAGVRHLGVEPSGGVAEMAKAKGIRVRNDFFEESVALDILENDGQADVIYAANTLSHIAYVDSIFSGVARLLAPGGVFVFEDPYWADIVERTSFDQIYDEHFFLFTATSVQTVVTRFGLELVDVERLPTHGGEVRYTLAHRGTRTPSPAVAELVEWERGLWLTDPETLRAFGENADRNKAELVALLRRLRDEGKRVVGYGATAKSATVTNFCGLDSDLVEFISDSTPFKQGTLSPGAHIPVRAPEAFADPYPDYALLFAWNHAEEIMAKEKAFRDAGGRWILYIPDVRVV